MSECDKCGGVASGAYGYDIDGEKQVLCARCAWQLAWIMYGVRWG
jgi:hypothetical protein